MTPRESHLLHSLGQSTLLDFTGVITFTILYGVFVLLFSILTSSFIRRGSRSRAAWASFTLSLITFVLATAHITAEITGLATLIKVALVEHVDFSLEARLGHSLTSKELYPANIILQWTNDIARLLGDSVVIWRAWVLFPGQRWVMILPISMLFVAATLSFTYVGALSTPTGFVKARAGRIFDNIETTVIVLLMATNFVTTLLISYKLRTYKIFISKNIGLRKQQLPALKILFLLIESGIIYFILQLVYCILTFLIPTYTPTSAEDFMYKVFTATYFSFTAMFPTIVIVLVNSQRSLVDTYMVDSYMLSLNEGGPTHVSRSATPGHLSFAPPTTTYRITDVETLA